LNGKLNLLVLNVLAEKKYGMESNHSTDTEPMKNKNTIQHPPRRELLFTSLFFLFVLMVLTQNAWANSLARIITTTGQVEIRVSAEAPWTTAKPLTELEAGAQIRTGADGTRSEQVLMARLRCYLPMNP